MLDALLPLCAALVAFTFAALLVRSFARRRSGEKVLWAVGFALFGAAAACEAGALRAGWSPSLFRAYYLTGGVLTVAYLGAGSAWLLLPRRGRDLLLRLADDVKEIGMIESQPLLDGRNMVMLLGPTKNAGVKQHAEDENTERSEEAVQGDGVGQDPAPADDAQPQPGAQVVEAEAEVR